MLRLLNSEISFSNFLYYRNTSVMVKPILVVGVIDGKCWVTPCNQDGHQPDRPHRIPRYPPFPLLQHFFHFSKFSLNFHFNCGTPPVVLPSTPTSPLGGSVQKMHYHYPEVRGGSRKI